MIHDIFFAQSDVGRNSLVHKLIYGLHTQLVQDSLSVLGVIADVAVEECVRGFQVCLDSMTVQIVKLLIKYGLRHMQGLILDESTMSLSA